MVTSSDLVFAQGTPKAWEGVVKLAVDLYHAAARTEAGQLISLKAVKEASGGLVAGKPMGAVATNVVAGGTMRAEPVQVTVENKHDGLSEALAGALTQAFEKRTKRELVAVCMEQEMKAKGLDAVYPPECWPPVNAARPLLTCLLTVYVCTHPVRYAN